MKFNTGDWIKNQKGEQKTIIVSAPLMKPHDWFIGLTLIAVGISVLTRRSFVNGARAFDEAEFNVMKDLGIIKD